MLITEQGNNKWKSIIKEELGVTDARRLDYMSKMAQVHELFESIQTDPNIAGGIYATPLNTIGMGNPMTPPGVGFNAHDGSGIGDTGRDFHSPAYRVGSGDIPMSTLTIALEVAAQTIGFDLVGVVPATGPFAMLQYMDYPYAGGKLGGGNLTSLDGIGDGAENKPMYIKVKASLAELKAFYEANESIKPGDVLEFVNEDGASLKSKYMGKSRIDGSVIVKVLSAKNGDDDTSIFDVMSSAVTVGGVTFTYPQADLVSTYNDHIQEFANFYGNGKKGEDFVGSPEPMTRAQNETGTGNSIGARFTSKMIQMASYEVTGDVTRQQLQDMPLYGIDVVGGVLEAMQNRISQNINNRILDRVFKLGVTNAYSQKQVQGVDLNLYFGGASDPDELDLADFDAAKYYVAIDGSHVADDWGPIKNATKNTAAENVYTHQRRIMTRILAARNLIAKVSRWGMANWVVCNAQIVSALQDCAQFVVAPMQNDLVQDGSTSLYYAGSVAGLQVYVDPNMEWDDTRVCVGRRSNGKQPGVIFMPYILADSVQIVAEGTMSPKLLMNSRYALVDAGWYPEANYYTFIIQSEGSYIL